MITGAARGIGRATALEFTRRGYNLALLDILPDELQATAAEAEAAGAGVFARICNLFDWDEAEAAARAVVDWSERIDVLVDTSVEIQEYVEDCSVCCQPIVMEASVAALGTTVQVRQEND